MANIEKVHQFYEQGKVVAGYVSRYQGLAQEYFERLESDLVLQMADFAGKRILDIGTGTGRMAFLLAEQAKAVLGIELSSAMIAEANRQKQRRRLSNVSFRRGDFLKINLPEGSFDVVLSIGTFEYVTNLEPFLVKIYKLLKPGGSLVFTVHNQRGVKAVAEGGPYPIARWSLKKLRKVLRANGFKLVSFQGTFFVAPWLVWRVFRVLPTALIKKAWLKAVISWNQRLIKRYAGDSDRQGQKAREWIILAQKQ